MRDQPVVKFMSVCPHTVGRDQTLSTAHVMMRRYGIRHLPVLDGGVLVGIISQRDLYFIETLRDVDPESVKVEDAMTPDPYFVAAQASLHDVVTEMALRHFGCAVVLDKGNVVGMFTTTDALRALSELTRPEARELQSLG